jgi:hypothetical protein
MITQTPTPIVHAAGGAVQLNSPHGDVRSGSLGRVIGRFARDNPTYVVSFGAEGLLEVRGDQITACSA